MKSSTIDLLNCDEYVGDIWKGANLLSNMNDEECIEEIRNNIYTGFPKLLNQKRKFQTRLVYHKIISYNGARKRDPKYYDGFFRLIGEKTKYYMTLYRALCFCESANLGIKSIEVCYGYSYGGEHLNKGGGGDE